MKDEKLKPSDLRGKPKVWYVLCGTKGKEVGCSYLLGVVNHGKDAKVADVISGKVVIGYNPVRSTFLSKQQAINDWRRRNDSETAEHADALKDAGERLIEKSEAVRRKLRQQGDWRDL